MSQDFSVLLHTPTDGTDGDCTASLKNPRGIEPRRILPQPRGSQAHTCMSPQSSDCLTFIHNLKPSDPSIFFRTPHIKCEGKWELNADGSGMLASGNISWDKTGKANFTGKIIANSGSIGGFEIGDGHIGVTATASGESSSADWANLSIYKDFFKVGGSKGYVMFGDDVIPSSMGGAFTAVGRIVNNAPNIFGSYGFDQANYGILIDVSGGTKNYGISSNAALKAPAFVNTEVKILTFTGNGYTIDH